MPVTPRARGRRRAGDEQGSVLVEAALTLPVVILVVFGIIEFGFAFRDAQTVASATRTGARVGVTLARQPATEPGYYLPNVLTAVQGALVNALNDDQIDYLTIYKADPTTGLPTGGGYETCTTDCARYRFSGGAFTQIGGTAWAPADMKACGSIGHTDYLGVYVRIHHGNLASVITKDISITDHTVMRLEPFITDSKVPTCE